MWRRWESLSRFLAGHNERYWRRRVLSSTLRRFCSRRSARASIAILQLFDFGYNTSPPQRPPNTGLRGTIDANAPISRYEPYEAATMYGYRLASLCAVSSARRSRQRSSSQYTRRIVQGRRFMYGLPLSRNLMTMRGAAATPTRTSVEPIRVSRTEICALPIGMRAAANKNEARSGGSDDALEGSRDCPAWIQAMQASLALK